MMIYLGRQSVAQSRKLLVRCVATKPNPTIAPKPNSGGGGGGAGKLLLALALAAPIGYVAFQTKTNETFREEFEEKFPKVYKSVRGLVEVVEKPRIDGLLIDEVKQEIQELERKWEMVKPATVSAAPVVVSEPSSKSEPIVKKPTVVVARKATEVPAAAPEPVSEPEPEPEEAPVAYTPPPHRDEIDQVQAKARSVKYSASKGARAKIQELENELRKELEVVLVKDLGNLDEEGLRKRLVQLVLELRDRNRWEALRLHELTKQHTEELVSKYEDLLAEQAASYEKLVRYEAASAASQASAEAEKLADEHYARVLQNKEQQWRRNAQEQLDIQRGEMSKEMEHRFNVAKANLQNQAAAELAARADVLEKLKAKVMNLQSKLTKKSEDDSVSKQLNKIAVATLDLQYAVDSDSESLGKALKTVEDVGGNDKVVRAALDSISSRVQTNGVLSLIELQHRFENVHESCHRVSLVPEKAGFLHHAGAALVSKLTLRSSGSSDDVSDTPEGHLSKARYLLLEKNDLEGAVSEMDKLEGGVKDTASDWLVQAKDRLTLEKAIALLRTHVSYTANKLA